MFIMIIWGIYRRDDAGTEASFPESFEYKLTKEQLSDPKALVSTYKVPIILDN